MSSLTPWYMRRFLDLVLKLEVGFEIFVTSLSIRIIKNWVAPSISYRFLDLILLLINLIHGIIDSEAILSLLLVDCIELEFGERWVLGLGELVLEALEYLHELTGTLLNITRAYLILLYLRVRDPSSVLFLPLTFGPLENIQGVEPVRTMNPVFKSITLIEMAPQ